MTLEQAIAVLLYLQNNERAAAFNQNAFAMAWGIVTQAAENTLARLED